MITPKLKLFRCASIITMSLLFSFFCGSHVYAVQKYSPNDVFSGVEYSNQILDLLLKSKNITDLQIPSSKEKDAKPMHVYELHVSVLNELYHYSIKNNRPPPPLPVSTPIKYTPTDVYYLTELVINNLEGIYKDDNNTIDFSMKTNSGKSPADVYQELFKLYYQLNRLNDKEKISPSEVYSHIIRAKEDLQYTLLLLSKKFDNSQEQKKRLLMTAIYGMHPDGTVISAQEMNKKPGDVMTISFEVRKKLNILRQHNKLPQITIPSLSEYKKIKPIDVFLQTQFIIAELNLLKIPLDINSTTNSAKPATGKTPSDVYQVVKHINYMLERLINTL
ncbi:MAG: hypothetical protein OQL19_14670 [Gammaproteobacteria bacterium]|nr:hypothetical protein [Gammaproteobacteria bacterium]